MKINKVVVFLIILTFFISNLYLHLHADSSENNDQSNYQITSIETDEYNSIIKFKDIQTDYQFYLDIKFDQSNKNKMKIKNSNNKLNVNIKFEEGINPIKLTFFDQNTNEQIFVDFELIILKTSKKINLTFNQTIYKSNLPDDNMLLNNNKVSSIKRKNYLNQENKPKLTFLNQDILNFNLNSDEKRCELEFKLNILDIESNNYPVINANDMQIKVGEKFDPLNQNNGLVAIDPEDGNLTSEIKIMENNVNNQVPGSYKVIYQVTDRMKILQQNK